MTDAQIELAKEALNYGTPFVLLLVCIVGLIYVLAQLVPSMKKRIDAQADASTTLATELPKVTLEMAEMRKAGNGHTAALKEILKECSDRDQEHANRHREILSSQQDVIKEIDVIKKAIV